MTQRIIILSDLHMAPPGPLSGFHSGDALAAFLEAHAEAGTMLVLAGDTLDLLALEERPDHLDLPVADSLLDEVVSRITSHDWGKAVFAGLRKLLDKGGTCVVMPGNHDPEMAHPKSLDAIRKVLGRPDKSGLTLDAGNGPLSAQVGRTEVVVGHGHVADRWNAIDPEAVGRAIETGDRSMALCPGSRLVVEVLNPLKLAVQRDTGQPRFPFVDLLKPELPGVGLLLLYLDWKLALRKLVPAMGAWAQSLTRVFSRLFTGGRRLAAVASTEPREDLPTAMARALWDELTPGERDAPAAMLAELQQFVSGSRAPKPMTLAPHQGMARRIARAAIRSLSHDGHFFDRTWMGPEDDLLYQRHCTAAPHPKVAVFGHTHAARQVSVDPGRMYLNTGTWMDLMKFPDLADDAAVQRWLDDLEAGRVPRFQCLTYAEITASKAALREWKA